MSEEIFKEVKIITQLDVENKQLKEENEKVRKEENEKVRKEENEKLKKENEQLRKNNVVKDVRITKSIEKAIEIKSPNWFDSKPVRTFLAITDSNRFHYKNKIGEFKYIDIKDLVNKIRNNAISKIFAKKGLNTLNEIKNAGIRKQKKRTLNRKNY